MHNYTKKKKPEPTVEEYIAKAPEKLRPMMKDLRKAIRAAAPKAEEKIKYNVPTYKLNGMWLVIFSATKKWVSFITVNKKTPLKFKKELEGFNVSGTTIHLTPEKRLSPTIIKRIVKDRVRENLL